MNSKKLSVIVPVYNEDSNVNPAFEQIQSILAEQFKTNEYEIIFVDDGSGDDSFIHLERLAKVHEQVKVIRFATNCGSHMAIRAGLEHCEGANACIMACDMQEPSFLIAQMYQALKEPFEIVFAVRTHRNVSLSNRIFAPVYYWLARKLVSKNIPPGGASMFMFTAKVIRAVKAHKERNLTLDGLLSTIGFKSTNVFYETQDRVFGVSKWTWSKRIKQFVDFFVAYSYFPIRMVSVLGILLSCLGLLGAIYLIIRHLLLHDLSPGWPALISLLLFGFGLTNISLGIIAEYLWRTLDEARMRPRYIVERTLNITPEREGHGH